MTFGDLLTFALRNIVSQRLRSLLTGGAIAIGGFLVFLLPSLGLGLTEEIRSELMSEDTARTLTITPKYEEVNLDFSKEFVPPKVIKPITNDNLTHFETLESSTGVRDVTFSLQPESMYVELLKKQVRTVTQEIPVYNTDIAGPAMGIALESYYVPSRVSPEDRDSKVTYGRYFESGESTDTVALVTSNFIDSLNIAPSQAVLGTSITLTFLRDIDFSSDAAYIPEIKTVTVSVIGIIAPERDTVSTPSVIIPTKLAYEIKAWQAQKNGNFAQNFTFDSVSIMAKDTASVRPLRDTLVAEGFEVRTAEDDIALFRSIVRGVMAVLASIGIIALVVGALAISNTMLMAVSERTKEIGILRSIGATQATILHVFLIESTLIALLGGMVGVVLGVLVSFGLRFILAGQLSGIGLSSTFQLFNYSPLLFVSVLGFVALVGLVSGILPALRASRLNVVESLRYE